ncbi:MAG: hypothetical protein ING71_02710 [Rhodocyclaceae bacterium]|nr:hypothetical protein [Rhodocyclaceae bacterium]
MNTNKSSNSDRAYVDFLRAEAGTAGSINQSGAQALLAMFEQRLPAAIDPKTASAKGKGKEIDLSGVTVPARKTVRSRRTKHLYLAKEVSQKLATYVHTKYLAASFEDLVVSLGPLIKDEQSNRILSIVDKIVSKHAPKKLRTQHRERTIISVLPENQPFTAMTTNKVIKKASQ